MDLCTYSIDTIQYSPIYNKTNDLFYIDVYTNVRLDDDSHFTLSK